MLRKFCKDACSFKVHGFEGSMVLLFAIWLINLCATFDAFKNLQNPKNLQKLFQASGISQMSLP